MPSICHQLDPKDLQTLSPYLELCMRLGSFARQAVQETVQPRAHYSLGGMIEFDTIPLTRAVQKGWLKGIAGDEGVNDVNAPYKIKALGIKVETTKSSSAVDYNELIEVRTIDTKGKEQSVEEPSLVKMQTPELLRWTGKQSNSTSGYCAYK